MNPNQISPMHMMVAMIRAQPNQRIIVPYADIEAIEYNGVYLQITCDDEKEQFVFELQDHLTNKDLN